MNDLPPLTASYDENVINLNGISMIALHHWPEGRWKAWGWRYVHQDSEICDDPVSALRSLIDNIKAKEELRGS